MDLLYKLALTAGELSDKFGMDSIPSIVAEFVQSANEDDLYLKTSAHYLTEDDLLSTGPGDTAEALYARANDIPHGNPRGKGSFLDYAGRIGQVWDGHVLGLPNSPSALTSALVMAPIGATLGYAGGRFGNYLTGGHAFTDPWKTTLMGAALGVTPSLLYGLANHIGGEHAMRGDIFNTPSVGGTPLEKTSGFMDFPTNTVMIPVDRVKDMLIYDPYVSPHIEPHVRVGALGLLEGANNMPGRSSVLPIVTPSDIAKMTVGLGSGYASGLLVGNALGSLFGISDTARNILRQSGAVAGLINSVIPLAFGA